MTYHRLNQQEYIPMKFQAKFSYFDSRNYTINHVSALLHLMNGLASAWKRTDSEWKKKSESQALKQKNLSCHQNANDSHSVKMYYFHAKCIL